jgi:hypothetical protein
MEVFMRLQVLIDSKFAHFLSNKMILGELILHSDDWHVNLKRFNVLIHSLQCNSISQDCTIECLEKQIVEAANVEKELRDEINELRKLNSATSRLSDFYKRVGGIHKLEEIVSSWESQQKAISENHETTSAEKSILINKLLDDWRGKKK